MTGDCMTAIEQLPDTAGMKNEVVIQTGHLVNYGHPIDAGHPADRSAVVAFGVGQFGNARRSSRGRSGRILPRRSTSSAIIARRTGRSRSPISPASAMTAGVPVIVDLAAEYDLTGYLQAGADITIHSAHKFLGGATAGIVAGRKALVRAAFLQNYGIGRPMKVGKEGIAAAIVALQAFAAEDRAAVRAALREPLLTGARRSHGHRRHRRPRSTPIRRATPSTGCASPSSRTQVSRRVDVVHALETGTPSIRVRTHQIEHGSFVMDPRSLGAGRARDRRRAPARRHRRGAPEPTKRSGRCRLEGYSAPTHCALWPDMHDRGGALRRRSEHPAAAT